MKPSVILGSFVMLVLFACGEEDTDWPSYRIPVGGTAADPAGQGGKPKSASYGGKPDSRGGGGAAGAGESMAGFNGGMLNGGSDSGGRLNSGGQPQHGDAGSGDGGFVSGGLPGGGTPSGGAPTGAAGSGDGGVVSSAGTPSTGGTPSMGGSPGAGGVCGELSGDCGACIGQSCCAEVEACEGVASCAAALPAYYACLNQPGVRLVDCGNQFEADADDGPGSEPEPRGLVQCIQKKCAGAAACE